MGANTLTMFAQRYAMFFDRKDCRHRSRRRHMDASPESLAFVFCGLWGKSSRMRVHPLRLLACRKEHSVFRLTNKKGKRNDIAEKMYNFAAVIE